MPIHKMNFDGGVFFAKQVGYIDNVDARMWASALGKYAKGADTPIMAVVDMTEVDRLCPTVTKTLQKLVQDGNVIGIVLITSEMMASRNARVMGKMGGMDRVRVFNHFDDAHAFVRANINPTFGTTPTFVTAYVAAPAF